MSPDYDSSLVPGCDHVAWIHPRHGDPLVCEGCGVLWPGEPLPEPAHDREGYGHVAHQPGFASRLRAALAQVPA